MRLSLVIVSLIIIVLAFYGYFKAVSSPNDQNIATGPKIEITPKEHDFGKVKYGDLAEQTFKVRNLGKEDLEIIRISTSCGCTTAEINKEKLAGQEETDLKVTYDTGAMSGSHAKGRQERTIFVKSNDPGNPQVEVIIYADVE